MTKWESTQEVGFYYLDTIFNKEFIKKLKSEFSDNIFKDILEVKIYLSKVEDDSLDLKNQEIITLNYPNLTHFISKELYIDVENPTTLKKIKKILKEIEEERENKCNKQKKRGEIK